MKVLKGDRLQIECTGREIYAFAETLGLIEDGDGLRVVYGYDGYAEFDEENLTAAERAEIANYMIARWTAWKDKT